jgi:hypothetical protein
VFLVGDGIGQPVGEVLDLDAFAPQQVGERVVLPLCRCEPGHVVEQHVRQVVRQDPVQLAARPVHQ